MMVDVTNFLISLAVAVAAVASSDGGAAIAVGTDLWVGTSQNGAGGGADPRAVLASYPGIGVDLMVVVEGQSVQIAVTGSRQQATTQLARRIYETLLETDEMGVCGVVSNWMIDAKKIGTDGAIAADTSLPNGWTVLGLNILQVPATASRSAANGDFQVTFNVDVRFCAND